MEGLPVNDEEIEKIENTLNEFFIETEIDEKQMESIDYDALWEQYKAKHPNHITEVYVLQRRQSTWAPVVKYVTGRQSCSSLTQRVTGRGTNVKVENPTSEQLLYANVQHDLNNLKAEKWSEIMKDRPTFHVFLQKLGAIVGLPITVVAAIAMIPVSLIGVAGVLAHAKITKRSVPGGVSCPGGGLVVIAEGAIPSVVPLMAAAGCWQKIEQPNTRKLKQLCEGLKQYRNLGNETLQTKVMEVLDEELKEIKKN